MTFEYGKSLSDMDYRDLEKRYITRFWADAAHIRSLDHEQGMEMFHGRKSGGDYSGLLLPYYVPGISTPVTFRLRRRNPEIESGTGKVKAKYLSVSGERNRLYFPPHITGAQLQDPSIPLVLVEGEFKTLALRRLAGEANAVPRFIPIGLSGIWNWRGVIGKEGNEHGERVNVKGPIPDLDLISFVNRKVIIGFDQDEAGQ